LSPNTELTMASMKLLLLLALVPLAMSQYVYEEPLLYDTFPDDFLWGVATSAYQIEGGYGEDGKSLSIWDTFCEKEGAIADGSDGKVACDSYHQYEEDARMISEMGVDSYRFSLAWTRIMPTQGVINPEGVQYYRNLIAALKARNIEPMVTLYHWDLPQALEDQGGWLNADVALWFEEYARACFQELGDEVKLWITINEPTVVSINGYGNGVHAPGEVGMGDKVYIVGHNLIRAHAKAYRVYHNEFAATQGGQIGITLNSAWAEPLDPYDASDLEASETDMQFGLGWYAQPILMDGKYPTIMREKIDTKSEIQGFEESRLPTFTANETAEIMQSSDFLGINYYSTWVVYPEASDITCIDYYCDKDVGSYQDETWYPAASSWLKVAPWGLRRLMQFIKSHYGDIPVYITENGFSDAQGNLDDMQREYYYKHNINQLLKASVTDNVDIRGYFAWSLMDNFEWNMGYAEKFGIHSVNFTDAARPRTPKQTVSFLSKLAADNGFVEDGTAISSAMDIIRMSKGLVWPLALAVFLAM